MTSLDPSPTGPLSEDELDRLQSLLAECGAGAMNIAGLDGFLAALVCTSDLAMPDAYLDVITGDDAYGEHHGNASGDGLDDGASDDDPSDELVELMLRHWDDIATTLERDEPWMPLLDRDEHGAPRGNDWAEGFLQAAYMHLETWSPLIDDEERAGPLLPLFALAHEHDPDPAMRPPPITDDEMRQELLAAAVAGVSLLHRELGKHRRDELRREREADTVRHEEPKVGRNEPCPCGSGKKLKKCCGASR